jgi:tRNA-2-methylthio-N6-dimethylallyladenosine synthase
MNEQDSLRIARHMTLGGYRRVESPDDADILIVNTCCIRQKAEEKVYSLLGRVRAWKGKKTGRILAVGGCVAQYEGKRLQKRMPHVDIVFGPHHVSRIERFVRRYRETGDRIIEVSLSEGSVEDLECPGVSYAHGLRAYVTIMEGCNNFCSYCIVPYVRGRERSRPVRSLFKEVSSLTREGVREITLIGQNVNAYRAPDRRNFGFSSLLKELHPIPGLDRLRFTTSNPKDLSWDLIHCFGEVGALCEHIHLPVQSGSDRILARMNRQYTTSIYQEKIIALRDQCPEIALTSDMIVGFPGERDGDFQQTLELMETVQFDNIFSFRFSPRKGTHAATLEDTVPDAVKAERLEVLQAMQRRIGLKKNRALEGRILEVLVEGGSRDGAQWMGRTRTNKVVNFPCERNMEGRMVDVRIERGSQNSLNGSRVDSLLTGNRVAGE